MERVAYDPPDILLETSGHVRVSGKLPGLMLMEVLLLGAGLSEFLKRQDQLCTERMYFDRAGVEEAD